MAVKSTEDKKDYKDYIDTMSAVIQINTTKDLLHNWLASRISKVNLAWLNTKIEQISLEAPVRVFFTAFSAVPRYTGKHDLQLTQEDLVAAAKVRIGWHPNNWSVDQAARTLLVLSLPQDHAQYLKILEQLFNAADVGELVALYQALPLFPFPEQLKHRAAEGVRSNMTAVFNAVALQNPYPGQYLDNLAWNQMVLKALFIGSPLHLIQGLDERANPQLAQMLVDYAHERWAAGRSVSPELWRCVGRFANESMLGDLKRVLESQPPTSTKSVEQMAGAIALFESSLPQAKDILAQYPDLYTDIQAGKLTWNTLTAHNY